MYIYIYIYIYSSRYIHPDESRLSFTFIIFIYRRIRQVPREHARADVESAESTRYT